MVADAQPVCWSLHLPLGACSESTPALDLSSVYDIVGPSAMTLHVTRPPSCHSWSLVPFASVLDLGIRFPHIRELHIGDIVVQPKKAQGAPLQLQHSSFDWLEDLVIANWSSKLPDEGVFDWTMLHLLQHMPRLKNLTVYTSGSGPFGEPASSAEQQAAGDPLQYPELPCSLARFICNAEVPVLACAHIISSSRDTLKELKVNVSDNDDAPVIAALVRVAPRLRKLDLRLRLRADSALWPQVKSVFAALARLRILSLETPLRQQPTLDLLAGLTSLRELILLCAVMELNKAAGSLLTAYVLRSRCLQRVTLRGIIVSDKDESRLRELCRSRRISCYLAI